MNNLKYWICFVPIVLTGCTLSFQNISTHGNAADLVDENLSTTPDISSEIDLTRDYIP